MYNKNYEDTMAKELQSQLDPVLEQTHEAMDVLLQSVIAS